jgi:hypothetical protein
VRTKDRTDELNGARHDSLVLADKVFPPRGVQCLGVGDSAGLGKVRYRPARWCSSMLADGNPSIVVGMIKQR